MKVKRHIEIRKIADATTLCCGEKSGKLPFTPIRHFARLSITILAIAIPSYAVAQLEELTAQASYPQKQTIFSQSKIENEALEPWREKLDPAARMLLAQKARLAKGATSFSVDPKNLPFAIYTNSSGELMSDLFIQLEVLADTLRLDALGVARRTHVGNIVIARAPVDLLQRLAEEPAVRYVQIAGKSFPLNDAGRTDIRADLVHAGTGVPAHRGEGVIVGVLDSGIDFTHADFSNANGTRIRFLVEYKQGGSQQEWTKAQIDANPGSVTQRDGNGSGGHGTHVTGTAAGGGQLNPAMTGMAPGADIIFVKGIRNPGSFGGFSEADVVAGCQYIFQKAAALQKPAVVNLSLGGHFGAHDGTSLQEQSLSDLVGPGKIIVAAAGNQGFDKIHAGGTTVSGQINETVWLAFEDSDLSLVDLWYDTGALDRFAVAAYTNDNGVLRFLAATPQVAPGQALDTTLTAASQTLGNVTIVSNSADPNNGDGHAQLFISDVGQSDISNVVWTVMSRGARRGQLDMWAFGGEFYDGIVGFPDVVEMPGNSRSTIGIPATAQKVLAVGAHVTKNSWRSADGLTYNSLNPDPTDPSNPIVPTIGQRAYFSSQGPTRDGRLAPDVAAPGEVIFSALSSHLDVGIGYPITRELQGGGYLGLQGTSMAAPHVSGVVALMLQANPDLDYNQVLQILQETARSDNFTGSATNNQFGAGKIDAFAAVQRAIASAGNFPPMVDHTAAAESPAQQQMTIAANITDDGGINTVVLNYRKGGESNFTGVAMSASNNSFQGVIPSAAVTSRGVEYFIEAADASGQTTRSPFSGIFSVPVTSPGETKASAQPADTLQTAYRLISVSLDLNSKDPSEVLADDLGSQSIKTWRLFDLQNDGWFEFPRTGDFVPGKAFFLIVGQPGRRVDTGAGKSIVTNQSFSIPLKSGWNLIGNPFNFAIPVSKLRFQNNPATPVLRTFDGRWSNVGAVTNIQPFEGYAVFNNSAVGEALVVDPQLAPVSSPFQKTTFFDETAWSIRISAQCQQARDTDNVAVIAETAAVDWDQFDQPEPPVIGDFVRVSFPHPEWGALIDDFCIDARPTPVDGEIWEFEVSTNIRDQVHLTFDDIEFAPAQFEVALLDEVVDVLQNLRERSHYTFVPTADEVRKLKLIVGAPEFIARWTGEDGLIPAQFELSQNFPNPFNPLTTIRFGLPSAETVTLKIFNIRGEEIATLIHNEQRSAGFHTTIWDSRNRNGKPVASGLYVYQLRTGKNSLSKKMLLVK
jgi:subtilisin family serine protease